MTEKAFTQWRSSVEANARTKISDAAWKDGWDGVQRGTTSATTTGWSPGCKCEADVVPCTILDPFAGAGTSLLVADRLQRDAIGIDLNAAYTEMAMERCRADAPLFTAFAPADDPEDERMADLFADAEYHEVPPRKLHVPTGWDAGPGAHGTIHRNGRTMPDAAE